jgi:hypothetical protein
VRLFWVILKIMSNLKQIKIRTITDIRWMRPHH